jgi:predicted transposase YbfD/YdcC
MKSITAAQRQVKLLEIRANITTDIAIGLGIGCTAFGVYEIGRFYKIWN